MKRIIAPLAAVTVAALVTLGAASPAAATEPDPHYADGVWQLRDWEGPYPEVETSDAALSKSSCDEVTLAKPDTPAEPVIYPPTGNGDIGTSYENTNLALAVEAGDLIAAEYEMSHVDNAGAGAVRMFAYDTADADTLNTAPTVFSIVPTTDTTGTVTIQFLAAGTVGTFGLTYDASNDTEGTVKFTNLRTFAIGDQNPTPIALCAKPAPETTTTTTTTTTTEAGKLADTGANLTTVLTIGGALLLAGVGVLMVARGRRATRG